MGPGTFSSRDVPGFLAVDVACSGLSAFAPFFGANCTTRDEVLRIERVLTEVTQDGRKIVSSRLALLFNSYSDHAAAMNATKRSRHSPS